MAKKGAKEQRPIIIKKVVADDGDDHHGGAWKVAYADFVTAMMAFFLLLWLLNSVPSETLKGVAEYFKPSIGLPGSTALLPDDDSVEDSEEGSTNSTAKEAAEEEKLNEVQKQLEEALADSSELKGFGSHVELQRTSEGLVINIVDTKDRPMFKPGTAKLQSYTKLILTKVGSIINNLPNFISVSGHTDKTHDSPTLLYGNWELSADRANSARRFLARHGVASERVIEVLAKSDTDPLDGKNPYSPENRRIAITLLKESVVPRTSLSAPKKILNE